ncbi:MAG: STAS domain-containing protein [Burkholderiales bacterium]|nr:STAS domain-containing protein [Burkholderiales bacterium]
MNINVNRKDGRASLTLKGRFDFTCHRGFKQAYEEAFSGNEVTEVVVDLREVDYLDSSALGMLLLLRDKGKSMGKQVSLANCAGTVRDVLRVANFDKLFTLH